ncbi:hypothetical protein [Flexivirga alba]|uniref:WD40 repeat domain-containing protein n=1 Tax=Flexivirga alba TaxID=702742 RepID=A0ABW2AHN6_9MICO
MDLGVRDTGSNLNRLTLSALSWVKGEGAPLDIVGRIARYLAQVYENGPVEDRDVLDALDRTSFYQRRSIDADGGTLYRLFHQGLADYLKRYPLGSEDPFLKSEADVSLAILRTTLGGEIIWLGSSPYLRRHALEHAIEAKSALELLGNPEFLIAADLRSAVPALDRASSKIRTSNGAELLVAASTRRIPEDPGQRCLWMAVAARQMGCSILADELVAQLPKGGFVPVWASGRLVRGPRRVLQGQGSPLRAISHARVDTTPVVITAGDNQHVNVWSLDDRKRPYTLASSLGISSIASAVVSGVSVAVGVGTDRPGMVWDLATGAELRTLQGASGLSRIATSVANGVPVAVGVGTDWPGMVWDLATGAELRTLQGGNGLSRIATSVVNGAAVAVGVGPSGSVEVWDLLSGKSLGLLQHRQPAVTVTTGMYGTTPVALATYADGGLIGWNLKQASYWIGLAGAISAAAISEVDGETVIVIGSQDGTVRIWLPSRGER